MLKGAKEKVEQGYEFSFSLKNSFSKEDQKMSGAKADWQATILKSQGMSQILGEEGSRTGENCEIE